MVMALPDWLALALFSGLVLLVTLYALALSVHFPAEHRRASLRSTRGRAILWGSTMAAGIAALLAIRLGIRALPWHIAVLAGGAAILLAPMFLKPLPDRLIDDRGGLVLFAGLASVLALMSLSY